MSKFKNTITFPFQRLKGIDIAYLSLFLLAALVLYFSSDNAFFWDTLHQASRIGQFYYDNQFTQFFLPDDLDAGHPPFFGMYIALCWLLFGKTLTVSHFAMLPFLWGIIWQLKRLVSWFIQDEKYTFVALLLLLTEVCFLGHSVLVSPDIVLLFGFILGVNGILQKRKGWLIVGAILMAAVSMRGVFAVVGLFLFDFLNALFLEKEKRYKRLIINCLKTYCLPFTLIAIYLIIHYLQTGWWISTPSMRWGTQRGFTDAKGLLKNGLVFGFRFLEYGKFAFWIVVIGLLYRRLFVWDKIAKQFVLLFFTWSFAMLPVLLLSNNPVGNRYLLPVYLILGAFTAYQITQKRYFKTVQNLSFIVLFCFQLSGHFWVYPRSMAQAWDCTLAHYPIYDLRLEMLDYIDKEGLSREEITTVFPLQEQSTILDLSTDERTFSPLGMGSSKYILYSNVINDLTDEELEALEKSEIVHALKRGPIEVILYLNSDWKQSDNQ